MVLGLDETFDLYTLPSVLSSYESSSRGSWTSVMTSSTIKQTNNEEPILRNITKQYIASRSALYDFCSEEDFDELIMNNLFRLPFLQALQTIELYSSTVDKKVENKKAYLKGILHNHKEQWQKNLVASASNRKALELSENILEYIGKCCLQGNCRPSDFTPEVCSRLQPLSPHLASKAVGAFNSNKRIVAGPRGGVINRPRFFLRLIQNVAEQATPFRYSPTISNGTVGLPEYELCADFLKPSHDDSRLKQDRRIRDLERDILVRDQREQHLRQQIKDLKVRLYHLQDECGRLQRHETSNDVLNLSYFD